MPSVSLGIANCYQVIQIIAIDRVCGILNGYYFDRLGRWTQLFGVTWRSGFR